MRTTKTLSLAATAALTAMAVAGASSASATFDTALCKLNPAPSLVCPAQDRLSHIHESTLPGNENRARWLVGGVLTIRCQVLFLGDVLTTNLLATAPAALSISGTFTYAECPFGCEVRQIGPIATVLVLKTAPDLAKVTSDYEVLLSCPMLGSGLHCVYSGEGLESHGLGAGIATELNGETRLEEQTIKQVSGSCFEIKLDLLMTPILEKVYIAS